MCIVVVYYNQQCMLTSQKSLCDTCFVYTSLLSDVIMKIYLAMYSRNVQKMEKIEDLTRILKF